MEQKKKNIANIVLVLVVIAGLTVATVAEKYWVIWAAGILPALTAAMLLHRVNE